MASIKIVDIGGGTAGFEPDIPGAQPGDPLVVDRGEGVTWDNQTNEPHWPWPIDADGKLLSDVDAFGRQLYLCDRIPEGLVSVPICNVDPAFSPQPPPQPPAPNVQSPTINYICRIHRHERGGIVVRNP